MKKNILKVCNFVLLHLIMLLGISSIASAASTVKMDLDDLVTKSDRIVIGKCVKVTSEWSKGKIYSQNTIQVSDNLKGDALGSYVVTTLGGKAYHPTLKTEISMNVSGGLIFTPNEEVVLFTKQNRLGQNQVVGMSQGKFNIVTDKDTGAKIIPLSEKKIHSEKLVKDIAVPGLATAAADAEKTVISNESIKLDQFVQKIKSKINKHR